MASATGRANPAQSLLSQAESEHFLRQVTTDFEELTWLRNLSNYIELCDVHNTLTDVAAATLPALRALIRAETIALIPADGVPGTDSPAGTYVAGESAIQPSGYREIAEHYNAAAAARPVVRNLRFGEGIDQCGHDIRSLILVRVGRKEYHFGWLLAINKTLPRADELGHDFRNAQGHSELEFGTFEAGMVSAAATLLGSHARNLASFEEQKQLFLGMIKALVNSIDAKDPYTCGHSERVAEMARRLGQELQQSPDECELLYMAGLLHDIGKIGMPDGILLKPAGLTADEFATIQQHPRIGAAIVAHLPQLSNALLGILHHHESYDGRGYPAQLAGEQIPWCARVLAVADAYDAMTSNRPYRPGMPTARAEQVLSEGAGKQWDARIVEAFLRTAADMRAICRLAANAATGAESRGHAPASDQPQMPTRQPFDDYAERCAQMPLVPA